MLMHLRSSLRYGPEEVHISEADMCEREACDAGERASERANNRAHNAHAKA
jgi:hypothetical protein